MKRQILNLMIISLSLITLLHIASAREATENLVGGEADCCKYDTCSTGTMDCSFGCGGQKEYVSTTEPGNSYKYTEADAQPCTGSDFCKKIITTDYTCHGC